MFCALLAGELTDQPAPLRVEELAFVSLAKYPYNPGHLLILPTRHTGDLEDLSPDEHAEIALHLVRGVRAIRHVADPGGFNVGVNLGRTAGAGIPEHLHWHVVPRWGGDTNFMPVIGQTRVLPELLHDTFAKLKPAFDRA